MRPRIGVALGVPGMAIMALIAAFVAASGPGGRHASAAEADRLVLRAEDVGRVRVVLTLSGAARDARVEISRRKGDGKWRVVATLAPGATRHTDESGIEAGATYTYRARTVHATSTGVIRGAQAAKRVSVSLAGAKRLVLVATEGGDGNGNDHAVWGTPTLVRADGTRVLLSSLRAKEFHLGYGERQPVRARRIGARDYPDSIWAHAASRLVYRLDEPFERFEAHVGICRSQGSKGSCAFQVEAVPARVEYSRELVVKTKDWHRSPGRTTYYVDSGSGDDSNPGTSKVRPWKSIGRVNGTVFAPGDKVLFKAGSRYSGQLRPMGSGGEGAPVVVDMYGGKTKPRIDGEGRSIATVHLYNIERWELGNLEITNTGKARKARRRGVLVEIKDFGTAHHIVLRGLYIHDVNGSLVKKAGGGSAIKWQNGGNKVRSRFDGLLIENCHLVRTERNGINAAGYWTRDKWYPSLNVVIRGNLLEEIPGDGIVPIGCDGALVERNVMRNCPRLLPHGDAAAGIWPWSSDNTVIQFNEVSDHKAPWDAQGFDSDWNCRNTVIQYNYSHDNEGGFLLVCDNGGSKMPHNIGNIGTIVRYNISVNDGLRTTGKHAGFSPTFHISGPCKGTRIYNNTIYVTRKPNAKIDRTIVKMDNWGGPWPVDTLFANNIFFVEGRADWEMRKARKTVFERNCFFGEHAKRPADKGAVLADPLFAGPVTATPGLDSLKCFMLRAGSPCIGAGKVVMPLGRDFWGAKLPAGAPCVGAHEAGARRGR